MLAAGANEHPADVDASRVVAATVHVLAVAGDRARRDLARVADRLAGRRR